MKDFLNAVVVWLLIQFVLIGIVSVWQFNQIAKGTYDCSISKTDTVPEPLGAFVPLVAFVPDSALYTHYCENQWPEAK